MSTYLHIASGAFRFVVGIDRVVEVSDLGALASGADSAGRRPWRDRNLPVISLGAQSGAGGVVARQQVILRNDIDGDASCALDVEQVLELVDIDDRRLQPLGAISESMTRLVDAAALVDGGHCLLRLRTPFAWHIDVPDPAAPDAATNHEGAKAP